MAFSDLDADGDLDAAFALSRVDNQYVSVLLNNGAGVFSGPAVYVAGAHPSGVTLGDVDGDGNPDLGVANFEDGTVSVLLNAGDATFGEAVTHDVGDRPISLIASDLNEDGLDDLVVLNGESEDVSVLLSEGGGTFASESRISVGDVSPGEYFTRCPQLTAGDVNADGHLDFAIPCKGNVKFLLGDGAGGVSLSPHVADVASTNAYDTVLADFNHDGRLDLASIASGGGPTALSVVFQNADGTWPAPVTYSGDFYDCPSCAYTTYSLAGGDIDADGDLDLVVGDGTFENVGIYRNLGGGVFDGPELHFTRDVSFGSAWVVELKDVNMDGALDLAYLDRTTRGTLHIRLNDTEGSFIGPVPYLHSEHIDCNTGQLMVAADMDLDGHSDIVLAHTGSNCAEQVSIHRSDGAGQLHSAARISLSPFGDVDVYSVGVADLNADGLPDLIVPAPGFDEDGGRVHMALNLGNFAFAPSIAYATRGLDPFWVATADIDADGDVDVAAWARGASPGDNQTPVDRRVVLFINDGTGALRLGQEVFLEQLPADFNGEIAAGDLDADGDVDLLATTGKGETPGRLWRLANDGSGRFEIAQSIEVGVFPTAVVIEDFDLDGTAEAALMFKHAGGLDFDKYEEPYLTIFENDGTGHLTIAQELIDPNMESNWSMHSADLNADGYLDLSLVEAFGAVRVHLNQGDGSFDAGTSYDNIGTTRGLAVGDFDADGRLDLAMTTGDYIGTLFGRACPSCQADINADGELSILDFVAFQLLWQAQDPGADCDDNGAFNVIDFVCFQQLFLAGCP